ncbi:MAG: PEP-CTERM sorting domain-containing protein [Phycisphaerae bacterium]|nr:PEP-CTERM sorting domain-containing protein [Phycisphaerae bacterium]
MAWRFIAALAVVALIVAPAAGDVVGADCYDDGDGAVTMGAWSWEWDDPSDTATMNVPETQHWAPAHIFTEFYTDTPEDPNAWVIKEVENDTDFDWTDYHINVSLDRMFTIVTATSPTDWLTPVITQPTLQGEVYLGTVEYYYDGLGTEIPIGETGEFGVKLNFTGSVSFCMEQIPTPEPSSAAMLALGALALLRRRR